MVPNLLKVGKRWKILRTRILIKSQRSQSLRALTNIRDKTGLQKSIGQQKMSNWGTMDLFCPLQVMYSPKCTTSDMFSHSKPVHASLFLYGMFLTSSVFSIKTNALSIFLLKHFLSIPNFLVSSNVLKKHLERELLLSPLIYT